MPPLTVVLAHEPLVSREVPNPAKDPRGIARAPAHLFPPPPRSPSDGAAVTHRGTQNADDAVPPFCHCVLDEALHHSDAAPAVIAVAARSFAWFSQWASARGISQTWLLNTGATTRGIDDRSAVDVVRSALLHACGPIMSPPGSAPVVLFPVRVVHALSGRSHLVASHEDLDAPTTSQLLAELCSIPQSVLDATSDAEPQTATGVVASSFARVGLMGNPSDQLHGRSIAVTVDNFRATVKVEPSPSGAVEIMPHPIADATTFGSLSDIVDTTSRNGYSGGMRIVLAACKRFFMHVTAEGLLDPQSAAARRPFRLWYDTNVPRQVGLAGSSCIVSAVFKALALFFGVALNLQTTPSAVLAAEWDELGIHAGLMDRVAQVWGGLVAMDFDKDHLTAHGYGKYERLDISLLPPLYLAYAMDPSDSGKIHSNVKDRYFKGDVEVVDASRTWRRIVDDAVVALRGGDLKAFCNLADRNFDLRRRLYGDQCLGWKNLQMIDIARHFGAAAKFPGSGGAILVMDRGAGVTDLDGMRSEMERHDYVLIRLRPCAPAAA